MRYAFEHWIVTACCIVLLPVACSKRQEQTSTPAESGAMKPASAHSSGAALKFTAPPEWVLEQPTSSMRQAQYRLARAEGDSEDAELVVFYFQGGGGGVQANIDRWIGQFSKADGSPVTDAKTTNRQSHGIPLTILDVNGTYNSSSGGMSIQPAVKPNYRMLAVVAESGSGPWFFRLTGPMKTVGKWEPSFQAFLDTIQ